MNKMTEKLLQPKNKFRYMKLIDKMYSDYSFEPYVKNSFIPLKYARFHASQNWRVVRFSDRNKY